MSAQSSEHALKQAGDLAGCTVVITRPAGTGATLARQIKAQGGVPLLLPGLSLRAAAEPEAARVQWNAAQQDDVLIFTSPAAVRFAAMLAPVRTQATVIAVGPGTATALRRHGLMAEVPATRQDSEGVLALPSLQSLDGRHVALITAPGGRGLLQDELAARGARLREVHVYRRSIPQWNRRHFNAVLHLPDTACMLLSSVEALQNLMQRLPAAARQRLCQTTTIVSSERIALAAQTAGILRVHRAASAAPSDMLAVARSLCSRACHEAGRAGC